MSGLHEFVRPGRCVPAVLLIAAGSVSPLAAQAQQARPVIQSQAARPPQTQPLVSPIPVPDQLELSKLIWSTIAAVHHANLAGNYSVLRDIAAPGFQIQNDAARLTQIFAAIRESRIDLSNALLLAPTYTAPPTMAAPDVLRVQGMFGLRPTAIQFDLYYQWVGGRWRLFGISLGLQSIAVEQGARATRPAPQQQRPR